MGLSSKIGASLSQGRVVNIYTRTTTIDNAHALSNEAFQKSSRLQISSRRCLAHYSRSLVQCSRLHKLLEPFGRWRRPSFKGPRERFRLLEVRAWTEARWRGPWRWRRLEIGSIIRSIAADRGVGMVRVVCKQTTTCSGLS